MREAAFYWSLTIPIQALIDGMQGILRDKITRMTMEIGANLIQMVCAAFTGSQQCNSCRAVFDKKGSIHFPIHVEMERKVRYAVLKHYYHIWVI